MPRTSYQSASWMTHRQEGKRRIEFPLEVVLSAFLVHRTIRGPISSYTQLALDTVDAATGGGGDAFNGAVDTAGAFVVGMFYTIASAGSTDFTLVGAANSTAGTTFWCTGVGAGTGTATRATAYFVEQGPIEWLDGDEMRYMRTFATVPASWTGPEGYTYLYPSFTPGTVGASKTITAIAWSAPYHVITTSAAHGFSAGNAVFLDVTFKISSTTYHVTTPALVITAPTSTTFTVFNVLGVTGPMTFSSVSGTAATMGIGRLAAKSLVAASQNVYDYALSSIASLDTDLPLSQKFTPVDSTGAETSALGTVSFPTAAAYGAMVAAGNLLVAEQSTRQRWRGNIFVRRTRFIPAQ